MLKIQSVSYTPNIGALKDIDKLENELRIGLNEVDNDLKQDFDDEKKKLIEVQKARVHDIVHESFLALNSLIPNPIKAAIRKGIRDYINGRSNGIGNEIKTDVSQGATDTVYTEENIHKIKNAINSLGKN